MAAANAYRSIALDDGIDPDYKGASYDAATEFFEYADKLDDAKPGLTTTAAADVLYGAIIDKMVAGQGDTVGATDYKDYVRAAKLALAQGGIDFVDEAYYNDYQSAAAGVIHTATAIHGTSGVTESQESKGAWNLALGKLAALDGNSTTADVDAFIAAANAYRDIALGDGIDPDYKGSSYDAVVEFFRLANIMDENRNSGANLDGDADYEAANDVYGALIGRFVAGDGPNVGADDYLEYIRDAKYALAKNGVKFLASDYYNDYQSAAAGMMHTAAAVENNVANGGTESQVSKDAWNLALGKLASLDENSTQADVDAFVAAANAYRSIALDDGVDPDYKGSSYEAATEFFEYADKLDDAKRDNAEKLADLADEVAAADAIYGDIINKMLAGEGGEINETHYNEYVEAVKAVLLKAGLITPEPTPSPTPAPVQQSSSNGGDNASHGGGDPAATTPAKAPSCDAPRPVGMPDLFQIDRKGSDAVLWFTPVRDYTNQYHVVFGHQDGEEKYGGIALHVNDEQNNGVQSITIHDLDPNKQYSFQVMAVNSCAVGDRSNWLSAKPVAKKSNVFTKTFRYLGK